MPTSSRSWIRALRFELTALALLIPLALVLGFALARIDERAETPLDVSPPPVTSPAAVGDQPAAPAQTPDASPPSPSTRADARVIFLAIAGPAGTRQYALEASGETTVADLLSRAATEQGLHLATKDFGGSLGIFVESLNGVRNDADRGMYWIFSVNGVKSSVGASTARVRPGDRVAWTYEPMTEESE